MTFSPERSRTRGGASPTSPKFVRVGSSESGNQLSHPRRDPPRSFAAYLNALRWNAVTATDARLFQSPLRAGIQLLDHQLTPP